MKICDTVYLIKIPFKLNAENRFVNSFAIINEKVCLIDCGPLNGPPIILDYLKSIGYTLEDVSLIINTHAHADHIGGNAEIKRLTNAKIAAHTLAVPWIENIDLQYQARPIPSFYSLVKDPTKVDITLQDGDKMILGNEISLRIIHTPGHSPGSISIYIDKIKIIFSGDAVPLQTGIGFYSNVESTITSLRTLQKTTTPNFLLSSWNPPIHNEINHHLKKTIDSIHSINAHILATLKNTSLTTSEVIKSVCSALNMNPNLINSLRTSTIEAHLKYLATRNKVKQITANKTIRWTLA